MDSRVKEKYQNNYMVQKGSSAITDGHYFIDTQTEFVKAMSRLAQQDFVAVDLEADSLFHFTEKICLIQMATQDLVYIIDPFPIHDFSYLSTILSDVRIKKIMHGADYDIRCLYRDYKISVNNLFDTELAARFLGYPETGLDAVLRKNFGVALEKKYQKKDWSQRPLPKEMTHYAADDVRHLIPLYMRQIDELAEKNRSDWVFEECEILSKVKPANADDGPLFTRVKGAGRLDPRSLAVLESLLEFRVKEAKQKDRPPFKIIGSHILLQIVAKKPNSVKQLKELNILSDNQLNRYGSLIIEIVEKALSVPKHQLPRYPRNPSPVPDLDVSAKIKLLKSWRQQQAALIEMDAGLLLNNSLVKTVAENNPCRIDELNAISEMKNWQKKEFGKEIVAVLARGSDAKTTI